MNIMQTGTNRHVIVKILSLFSLRVVLFEQVTQLTTASWNLMFAEYSFDINL